MATTDELSNIDLITLKKAGEWGLLRNMSGWHVCATGKASMKRDHLARLIEIAGGTFTNTMQSGVRLLIVADEGGWTTKMQKAEDSGVKVMRERDFVQALLPTPDELLNGERTAFTGVNSDW